MRKSVRFLALFCAMTLLFSCVILPKASSNSDAKYKTYVNMGDNAVKNGYAIPNIFRQNSVYSNIQKAPLVIKSGVEYVPLSTFVLFPYIDVQYGRTDEQFFLLNNRNNRYLSFNTIEGVASTYDGDLIKMPTPYFYNSRYVPAKTVAMVLGLECEVYDDPVKGICSVRVSDGNTGKTLAEMLKSYIDANPHLWGDAGTTGTGNDSGGENSEDGTGSQDPLRDTAERKVGLCFTGLGYNHMSDIVEGLEHYKIKASFSFTKDEILSKPDLVRKLSGSGNSIFVTAEAQGVTAKEYADSFIAGLNDANGALKLVLKKKTRMCTLPYGISEEIRNDEEFLSAVEDAGYLIFTPSVETGDGPAYKGSAYAVSGIIKKKITDGFARDEIGTVTALLWCSDKTYYYNLDVALLVSKYRHFSFFAMDEVFLYNN